MLLWRNHHRNRSVMFNQKIIKEKEHIDWWEKNSKENNSRILIFEFDNEPAGVVIFFEIDHQNKSAHWGFYLNVEALEKNKILLRSWIALERETILYGKDMLQLKLLICETLASNKAVLNLHLKNNFKITKYYTKQINGKLEDVVETSLDL